MPHARIGAVDLEAARGAPGVAAAYASDDLDLAPLPPSGTVEAEFEGALEGIFERDPIARDVVRFVGELLAVVVADTVGEADDAAELVVVEYDELPMVVDAERAAEFADAGANSSDRSRHRAGAENERGFTHGGPLRESFAECQALMVDEAFTGITTSAARRCGTFAPADTSQSAAARNPAATGQRSRRRSLPCRNTSDTPA